jgi:hypothetical protein
MTGEVPPPSDNDQTTGAIYDVIHTMDGEGSETAGPAVPAAAATANVPEADTENRAPSGPPDRMNAELEGKLIDYGTFGRRSAAQRRVLGCLGCKLASQPGSSGTITSREIANCAGMDNSPVRRILTKLRNDGFLFSRIPRRDPDADKEIGRPPELFSLDENGKGRTFKGGLEAPEACGLDREEGLQRPNALGEQKLIAAGVLDKRGSVPRALLGCLACRRQDGEGVYIAGVEKCLGTLHSSSLGALRKFVDGGVLKSEVEERTTQGRPKVLYTFTDSPLAQSVIETLETPQRCGLEGEEA